MHDSHRPIRYAELRPVDEQRSSRRTYKGGAWNSSSCGIPLIAPGVRTRAVLARGNTHICFLHVLEVRRKTPIPSYQSEDYIGSYTTYVQLIVSMDPTLLLRLERHHRLYLEGHCLIDPAGHCVFGQEHYFVVKMAHYCGSSPSKYSPCDLSSSGSGSGSGSLRTGDDQDGTNSRRSDLASGTMQSRGYNSSSSGSKYRSSSGNKTKSGGSD